MLYGNQIHTPSDVGALSDISVTLRMQCSIAMTICTNAELTLVCDSSYGEATFDIFMQTCANEESQRVEQMLHEMEDRKL